MENLTIHGITQRMRIKQSNSLDDYGDGTGTDYILLKCHEPLTKEQQEEIFQAQVESVELVGDNLYLCHYKPTDLSPLQRLDFVEGVQIYRRAFKVAEPLSRAVHDSEADTRPFNIVVTLHANRRPTSTPEIIRDQLSQQLGLPVDRLEIDTSGDFDYIIIREVKTPELRALDEATKIDGIKAIEKVTPKTLYNDRARNILGLGDAVKASSFQGEGQVLAVADTGLDIGSTDGIHPAFQGRVKELIAIGRPAKNLTDDRHGHGTHVCASAVGAPASKIAAYANVQGIAPKAQLVMQSLYKSAGESLAVPDGSGLAKLFTDPYDQHGVRVHSNSWGDSNRDQAEQPVYSQNENQLVDQLIWDRPDLLIVISAGNDGASGNLPTISGISACKNVLTVGATESTRPSVHGVPSKTKLSDNDPTEVSWYSARGPTREQRIKPDVLAPGTAILSAQTQAIPKPPLFTPSDDKLYCYGWGTSMSTPLVAGAAIVLREFLSKTYGIQSPSAALLKALLINGAYAFHHAHGGKEGFGLVNLPNSMILPEHSADAGFVEGKPFTDRGQEFKTSITIPAPIVSNASGTTAATGVVAGPIGLDPGVIAPGADLSPLRVSPPARRGGVTLKVTLVWTDPPGERLQNLLTLSVLASDGTVRNGNRGSSKLIDRFNNVQQVIWKGITPGEATVKVTVQEITKAGQTFALVWRIIPNEE